MGTFLAVYRRTWAFAAAGQAKNVVLFAALASAMMCRVGQFKLQEVANTAWAFAATGGALRTPGGPKKG